MVKDADLFAAAMAGVKPLKRKRAAVSRLPPVEARAAVGAAGKPVAGKPAAPPPMGPVSKPRPLPVRPGVPDLSPDGRQFDRDVSRALSRRKLSPEATIDLHGMTLAAAERAVTRFLERASAHDLRVVLVGDRQGPARRRRPHDRRPHPGRVRGAGSIAATIASG